MSSGKALAADLRALAPAWLPASTALMAFVAALVALAQRDALRGPSAAVVFAAVACAPFLLDWLARAVLPRPLFAIVVLAAAVPLMVTDPPAGDLAPFLLVVLSIQLGATAPLAVGVGTMVLIVGALVGLGGGALIELHGPAWVFGVLAAYAGGHAVQKTLLLLAASRAREHEVLQRVGSEERERIAREVHDVVAHSLSVTLLHLGAARRALEAGAADDAADALRDAEALGRRAMADIRSVVGMLRSSAADRSAPPTLADLPRLIRSFTDAGLRVDASIDIGDRDVPPTVALALFRLVQESLANAAKHAPSAHVDVRIVAEPDALRLTVRNPLERPLAAAAAGLGLTGMRERARLLGASLSAGPRGDDWTVEALLPLAAAPRR